VSILSISILEANIKVKLQLAALNKLTSDHSNRHRIQDHQGKMSGHSRLARMNWIILQTRSNRVAKIVTKKAKENKKSEGRHELHECVCCKHLLVVSASLQRRR